MLIGSGSLPKSREVVFKVEEEDLFLVPTAEVQLLSMYRDEVLDAAALPLRLVAYTPCFRNEKMSAGRDVRGIKRDYQFDKVEMFVYSKPEDSPAELDRLVRLAGEPLEKLGLSYRVKELCTGNLAFQAAKAIDLDVWSPGVEEWLEVSSCSNCTEFQSHHARSQGPHRAVAHAERVGPRPGAHAHCGHGELSARRWIHRGPARAAALPSRPGGHHRVGRERVAALSLVERSAPSYSPRGGVSERFKEAALKAAWAGLTSPRGFESHLLRGVSV